jgi:hypothetical protein
LTERAFGVSSRRALFQARNPVKIRCGRATVIGLFDRKSDLLLKPSVVSHWGREFPEECFFMINATYSAPTAIGAIPLKDVVPWLIFAGLICLLGVYFVGAEEGATSIIKGMYVHEFVHDSRHLLGFPCH